MRKRGVLAASVIVAFIMAFVGGSKAFATMQWADQHQSVVNAYYAYSGPVTHFLEGGQESCYDPGKACYFVVYWGYWNGMGWVELGDVSHSTDLDWPTNHASRLLGLEFPALEHGNSSFDYHSESVSYWISPCNQYIFPYVWAYDENGTALSYSNPGWMYYSC